MEFVLRLDNKSRMSREVHVRFRESLGVRFPRATRLAIGFRHEADARRVMEVLPKRFEKYGLTIHPDKTRLICFDPPSSSSEDDPSDSSGETFDLSGFTHYWGVSQGQVGHQTEDCIEPFHSGDR